MYGSTYWSRLTPHGQRPGSYCYHRLFRLIRPLLAGTVPLPLLVIDTAAGCSVDLRTGNRAWLLLGQVGSAIRWRMHAIFAELGCQPIATAAGGRGVLIAEAHPATNASDRLGTLRGFINVAATTLSRTELSLVQHDVL